VTSAEQSADGASAGEGVDQDLLDLPAPPRGRRVATLAVMALVVVGSLGLLLSLTSDLRYYFAPSRAADLGEAVTLDPSALVSNAYVTVRGTPMMSGTVRYSRFFSGASYLVFPLAGQRSVFVQVPMDGQDERTFLRREFSGRLVTFGQLGSRFATVRNYLQDNMDMPVSSESYVVLADETPQSYVWVLGLGGLCVLFIVINVWMLMRWFKPLPRLSPPAVPSGAAE